MIMESYAAKMIDSTDNFSSMQDSSQHQKALESSESMRATVAEAKASQLQLEVCFSLKLSSIEVQHSFDLH